MAEFVIRYYAPYDMANFKCVANDLNAALAKLERFNERNGYEIMNREIRLCTFDGKPATPVRLVAPEKPKPISTTNDFVVAGKLAVKHCDAIEKIRANAELLETDANRSTTSKLIAIATRVQTVMKTMKGGDVEVFLPKVFRHLMVQIVKSPRAAKREVRAFIANEKFVALLDKAVGSAKIAPTLTFVQTGKRSVMYDAQTTLMVNGKRSNVTIQHGSAYCQPYFIWNEYAYDKNGEIESMQMMKEFDAMEDAKRAILEAYVNKVPMLAPKVTAEVAA